MFFLKKKKYSDFNWSVLYSANASPLLVLTLNCGRLILAHGLTLLIPLIFLSFDFLILF